MCDEDANIVATSSIHDSPVHVLRASCEPENYRKTTYFLPFRLQHMGLGLGLRRHTRTTICENLHPPSLGASERRSGVGRVIEPDAFHRIATIEAQSFVAGQDGHQRALNVPSVRCNVPEYFARWTGSRCIRCCVARGARRTRILFLHRDLALHSRVSVGWISVRICGAIERRLF